MKIGAVAFDAYGTILDTGTGSVDATKRILERNGSNLDPKSIYQEWKLIHQQIIASLLEFENEENIFRRGLKQIYDKYHITGSADEDVAFMLAILGRRKVYPDTLPCLGRLNEKYQIIIASNSDTRPLLDDIRRNHIFCDCLLTSENLKVYKPRPEFYQEMLKVGQYMSDEVVYVGDSILQDVEGPKLAGIQAIWLNRKEDRSSEIEAPQITSLEELPGILETLAT